MGLATLVIWIITALLGGYMLGIVGRTGRATSEATRSRLPTSLLLTHPALALLGLVLWVLFMATGSSGFAWAAFVTLLVVATLGEIMAFRWLRGRRRGGEARRRTEAELQIPTPAVVTHGILAFTTIVLVLLGALGVGYEGFEPYTAGGSVVAER